MTKYSTDGMTSVKRVEDLPHFHVGAANQLETRTNGYTDFEFQGTLDRIHGVYEGRCCLLLPERECFVGDLKFVNVDSKSALFHTSEKSIPSLSGLNLPYLPGQWEPYHVWMVIEPEWIWSKALFQAADARAGKFQAEQVSIIDGQEVKEWIEIRKVGSEDDGARYFPVFPNGSASLLEPGPDGIIKGGWNHEHCDICGEHIESGEIGLLDRSGHKLCEKCHRQYVLTHDLSFLGVF